MQRLFTAFILLFVLSQPAQAQLRKQRLIKFDPAGGLFHELRVGMEHRIKGEFWGYVAPFGSHQNWIPKQNNRFNQPIYPQKYYGLGLRAGARKYFSGDSPKGLFFNGMLIFKQNWVNQYDAGLSFVGRDSYRNLGVGATVGWQNLYGRKDNIAYGFHLGMEYFYRLGEEDTDAHYVENWYAFPFNWKPEALNGFRIYLGIEIGFALLQKRLHW